MVGSIVLGFGLEVLLWRRGDPGSHFRGELLHDVGMLCGKVPRLGGIGAEIVEFEFAIFLARGVTRFPLAFANEGLTAGRTGFREVRLGSRMRTVTEPRGGSVFTIEVVGVDLHARD